jgi:DNA-binding CsgD family transcriptional regulator
MEVNLLTSRELEIFTLLGQGLEARSISDKLGISISTVEAHKVSIRNKLKVNGYNNLAKLAIRWINNERITDHLLGLREIFGRVHIDPPNEHIDYALSHINFAPGNGPTLALIGPGAQLIEGAFMVHLYDNNNPTGSPAFPYPASSEEALDLLRTIVNIYHDKAK